ncbi:MAG: PAS domain S-box protein [Alphaproteobacteria bacterium]|nr:PAS domain S-box protein [Alphaproteobacteria bacterium]
MPYGKALRAAVAAGRKALSAVRPSGHDVPVERRESRVIVLAGAIIVLFIAGFAGLMVRELGDASRLSNREHVEQLHKAVTHQLGTMMFGIQQTMRHAEDEIRRNRDPQKLVALAAEGRVSLHLLVDLIFIDPDGRVVVSTMRPADLGLMSNRGDREYFALHLASPRTDSRIGRPIRGRRTGVDLIPVSHAVRDSDGGLMGVLVAYIDIKALARIWTDIGLKPQDRIDLIGEDGKTWRSWPDGAAVPDPAIPRMTWSRPIAEWPIEVVATLDQATIDLHSQPAQRAIVILAGSGALIVVLLCLLLANRHAANGIVKARLLATIEAIPIEYLEFDRDNRLVLINRAARLSQGWTRELLGKTQRELLEQSLPDLLARYPGQDWQAWIARRMDTVGQSGTYELTRPSGETGRFFAEDMPGGGRVVLRVDITESRRREAELAATQDRYRRLFDNIPYPLFVLASDTRRFLMGNEAMLKAYGWSREELGTMTSDDFYTPEDLAVVREMRKSDGFGVTQTVRGLKHRRKDGTFMDVDQDVRPMDFNGVPALLIMVQDVSARLAAERARAATEEQLRQSQKMEAVGQLTGGIAHDFNNILTVILANTDELQEDTSFDAAVTGRLDQIGEAVLRASDLTRHLLAFSRKAPLMPRQTDVNQLVSGTGKLLRRALGEHIEIESLLAADLWTVDLDRALARDAMPGGGRLRIETRNVVLEKDTVTQATDVASGDYAMLGVTDTGCGIPPEALGKVFEPFFTTKGLGKGTGLGLSMVYGFIKQSRGHITIHSDVGRGTTFKLYLPRSDGAKEATVLPAAPIRHGTERILVVEDEPQVRASVVLQLQSLGYTVTAAADGAAGVASFEASPVPFDLLLTDVVMPGALNGRALADVVARRWPATRIVFMSGYTDTAMIHDGRLDAGVLLLGKPFRRNDLARMMRQALDAPSE